MFAVKDGMAWVWGNTDSTVNHSEKQVPALISIDADRAADCCGGNVSIVLKMLGLHNL